MKHDKADNIILVASRNLFRDVVEENPHIIEIEEVWYMVERAWTIPYVTSSYAMAMNNSSPDKLRKMGFTVTPLLLYKVLEEYHG